MTVGTDYLWNPCHNTRWDLRNAGRISQVFWQSWSIETASFQLEFTNLDANASSADRTRPAACELKTVHRTLDLPAVQTDQLNFSSLVLHPILKLESTGYSALPSPHRDNAACSCGSADTQTHRCRASQYLLCSLSSGEGNKNVSSNFKMHNIWNDAITTTKNVLSFLDPEGESQKATLIVLFLLVLGISSLRVQKSLRLS